MHLLDNALAPVPAITNASGAGPSWVRRKLPEAISRITEQRPDVQVEVQTGFDSSLLRGLATGTLDFVVAERPIDSESANLEFHLLTADDLICVGRPQHPLAGRTNVPPVEALALAWALPPDNTLARRKLDGRGISLGLTPPRANVVSTSLTFLLTHAAQTDTLIYTTRSQLLSPEGSRLIEIDVPDLVTNRQAGLIYRKPGLLTPAARAVADRLRDQAMDVIELSVSSHGERNLLIQTPDGVAEPRNRRVEVSVR